MMKTSELQGAALDWAVAKCEGRDIEFDDPSDPWLTLDGIAYQPLHSYTPSTDWAQGGPIIERERIAIWFEKYDDIDSALPVWAAVRFNEQDYYGSTPLIAAMRCYVASKLGDEIEIPVMVEVQS
jgi:hypothetical protein